MALSTDDPGIRARREERAPVSYRHYLNTDAWRRVRNRALADAGYACQRCGRRRDLQVHHRTYVRLGREWSTDLEVVCFVCHRTHHEDAAANTDLGIYLTVARTVLASNQWASFADLSADAKQFCADHDIPQRPDLLNKAILMVTAMRTSDRGRPYVSVVDIAPETPEPTHAQACELLTRLFGGTDLEPVLKTMPSCTPLTDEAIQDFRRRYVWNK
jgi:hypothetical protein